MDPLSFTASLIAVVGLAGSIISACREYIAAVENAPKDLVKILIEVGSLKCVFEVLELQAEGEIVSKLLQEKNNPIEGCKQALGELEPLVTERAKLVKSGKSKKLSLQDLAWPLKESKVQGILKTIAMYKSTITLALDTETRHDMKTVKQTVERINLSITEDECQAIFKWLEVTDPSSIHNKSCDLHEPYTGDWIFRSEDFGKWLEGSDRFFWLHGIPGAGKTVLASYIIEEVKKEIENYDLGIFLAYYYCYFGNGQDETAPCLRWIISQLCRQSNHIPEEVRKLYKQGTEPRVSELLDALAAVLTRIVYAYIVIDALDESLNRRTLLDTLVNLASKEAFQNLQILCLSRKEEDINLIISDIGHNMSLSNELVDEDIHAYIQHQLTTDHDFTRWPENLLNQIETSLVRGAQGMFRWVACQLKELKDADNASEVRQQLKELPETLDETYERILQKIPKKKSLIVRKGLLLLCGSKSAKWSPSELSEAVVVNTDQYTYSAEDRMLDPMALIKLCASLISPITDSADWHIGYQDPLDVPYRLAHYTVREYLTGERILLGPAAYYHVSESEPDIVLAKTVLTYLLDANYDQYPVNWDGDGSSFWGDSDEGDDSDPDSGEDEGDVDDHETCPKGERGEKSQERAESTTLLASRFFYTAERLWPFAVLDTQRSHENAAIKMLALRLLDPSQPHFAKWLKLSKKSRGRGGHYLPCWDLSTSPGKNITLGYLCYFKLDAVIETFLDNQNSFILHQTVQLVQGDAWKTAHAAKLEGTPLQLAVNLCDSALVKLFLSRGCSTAVKDSEGNSLLSLALLPFRKSALGGAEDPFEVVKLLLDAGVDKTQLPEHLSHMLPDT